jgi:nucleoid-associated protein YgaU
MKAFNINTVNITPGDMANVFNVYPDQSRLPSNALSYAINRTVFFKDLDLASSILFDEYIVKEGDEWSLLSYGFYGTVEYWWIICKINKISNPLNSPVPDTTLKILRKQYIKSILTALRNS